MSADDFCVITQHPDLVFLSIACKKKECRWKDGRWPVPRTVELAMKYLARGKA